MAGIVDQILLNLNVIVSGASGVSGLTGNIGGLNAGLLNLSAGLNVVQQVTSGVGQMVGQLTVWADAANKAATNTKVFGLTVSKFGIDIDQANGAAERLAAQFGVSVTDIQDSMTTLIRVGFTNMGQLEKVMQGAGASAIAAGRDAKAGFSNIADAAATGMSAQLNSIGIAQDLSTYNDKLAKSLGKTTDALTSGEKAQALYNLVTEATGTEVEALGSIQNDYVKSQQAVTLSQQQFSIQLGQLTMPLVQRFNQLSAESTVFFTGLLKTYAEGGDVLGVLADRYPLLGKAVKGVSDIFMWAKDNAGALVGGLTGALLPGVISVAGGITAALLPALAAGAVALWALIAPIAPFIAAGAAIGFVLQKMGVSFDDVKTIVGKVGSGIGEVAGKIPAVWERVKSSLQPTLDTLSRAFTQAFDTVERVINTVLLPLFERLAPKLQTLLGPAQDVVSGFGTFLKGVFDFVVNNVSGFISGVSDLIDNVLIPVWQRIGPAVEAAFDIVVGVVKGAFILVGGALKSLGQLLSGNWQDSWDTIKKTVSNAWGTIADSITNAWPVIENQIKNLAARISMAFQSGLGGLKSILLNALASMLEWAAEKMPSILQSAALKAAGAARAAAAAADGGPQPKGSGVLVGAGPTLPGQGRVVPGDLSAFAGAIISQSLQARNDAQADSLVDYCDRWVRDTLGDAAPKVRAQIDKLFRDGAPGGVATAISSEKSLNRANLTNKYNSVSDLKPGDTVFYTEGGQNHTGIYLGNGVVRGNNRVTYQENGGRFGPGGINGGAALDTGKVNPVGNVDINRLGTVTSYVRSADLLAYLERATKQTVTPQAGRQPKEKGAEPALTPGKPPADEPTPLKDTLNARLKQAQATFDLVDKNSAEYQKAVDRYLATLSNVQRSAYDAAMKLPESDASRTDLAGIVKSTRDKISGLAKSGGAVEALKKQIEDARTVFGLYTKETPGYDKALEAYLAVLRKAASESQKLGKSMPAGDKKNALSSLFTSASGEIENLSKKDGLAESFKRQLEDARAAFQLVSQDAPGYQKAVETYIAALGRVQAAAQKAIPGTKDRTQKNALSDLVSSTRSEVDGLRQAGTDADKIAEIVRQKSEARAQSEVNTAKQSVNTAQRAYDDGLKLAGDNVTKKLEVVKNEGAALQAAREQQAQRDYQLAKVQADNSLKAALDAAAKGKPALREAAEQLAQAQHTGSLNVAGDARSNALLDAKAQLEKDATDRAKIVAGSRLEAERALAAGSLSLAKSKAQGVIDSYGLELKAAEGNADKILGVEQRLGKDVLAARNVISKSAAAADTLSLEQQRNAAVNAVGLNLQDRQDLWKQYNEKIAQRDRDLQITLKGNAQDSAQVLGKAQETVAQGVRQSEASIAQARRATEIQLSEDLNQIRKDRLAAETADSTYLTAAQARDRQAQLDGEILLSEQLNQLRKDRLAEEERVNVLILASNEQESAAGIAAVKKINDAEQAAADDAAITVDFLHGQLDELFALGRNPSDTGFIGYLDGIIDKGGQAAEAARKVKKEVQALLEAPTVTGARMPVAGPNTGNGALIIPQGPDVAARDKFKPVTDPTEVAGRIPQGTIDRQKGWVDLLKQQDIEAYKVSLSSADMTDAMLTHELAIAAANQEASRYALILAEQKRRTDEASKSSDEASKNLETLAVARQRLTETQAGGAAPFATDIAALEALRGKPGVVAAELDKLIAKYEELQAKTSKQLELEKNINTLERYAKQAVPMVTAAMSSLGGMTAEVAGQWGSDLSGMVDDVANFAKSLSKGDYVAAAIQALTSIFTFFSKRAEAFRAELKKTADYNKGFRFDNEGYGTRKVETYTTGILFWQTTHFKETIDEASKALALSFEGGIVSGTESGFKAALASGSKQDFTKSIYDGLKEVAFKGLVDGFLNSAPVIAVFGPLVAKLMEAFKSGNKDMIATAISDFKSGVASLQPQIDGLLEAGKAIDDSLTTPEEKARKAQAAANELTQGRINNVQTLYDLQNRSANSQLDSEEKLKRSAATTDEQRLQIENEYAERRLKLNEAYQRQKLATALETNRLEMENALAATGLTEETKANIREQFRLKSQGDQQGFDEWLLGQQTDMAVRLADQQQQAADKAKQLAKEAADQREGTLSSWRQSLASGIQAFLSGNSPLDAMYKAVRDRISQAIQDGFIAKRILSQLDPLFSQLDAALSKGLDSSSIIQRIGAALPGLGVQIGSELGPILGVLNNAIPDLTRAVNGNTQALSQIAFQSTTILSYAAPTPSASLRAKLPRFA